MYESIRGNSGTCRYVVKTLCPLISRDEVPVTDFGQMTRSFIAYSGNDPAYTFGMPVDAAYNLLFEECIKNGITHAFIVESDVVVPRVAMDRLLVRCIDEGHPFVCGVYPFKDGTDICPTLVKTSVGNSRLPAPYVRRGLVRADHSLIMGCAMIDISVLGNLKRPWFKTTSVMTDRGVDEDITQDTWFTHNMMNAGYMPMVDTNIQCVHVDRNTRECFGSPDVVSNGKIRPEIARYYAINDPNLVGCE